MSKVNRYIYHYCAVSKGNVASCSGIAQLTFRVVSHSDLEKLKEIVTEPGFTADAITSLSYLGREIEEQPHDQ